MDSTRFDEFTKALATRTSRRQALKTLAATTVGGIFGLSWVGHADARLCRDLGQNCSSNAECCSSYCPNTTYQCACAPGLTGCNGTCTNTNTDSNNCGKCGNVCTSGQICVNGTCTNTNTDSNNCGKCGNVCTSGQICVNGTCQCPSGTTLCGGTCKSSTCGHGQFFNYSTCSCQCQTVCNGQCCPAGCCYQDCYTCNCNFFGCSVCCTNAYCHC